MSHTPKFHADDGSERIKAIRAEFEQHYVCNVSDYSRHPLGSQRCGDQWRGWLAAWTQRETESTGLLSLLYDIRAAAGDNEGRLMQSELVELISGLRADAGRYRRLRDGEWNRALPNGRTGLIVGNFDDDLDAAIDAAVTDKR